MELKQIYQPIAKELSQVESELKKQINQISKTQKFVNEIISYFFNIPGKCLRPALILLSAKAVNNNLLAVNYKLTYLAIAIELIHNATLIHDDIIDNATKRRKQISLNKHFDNRIAVLAGDILYARAFSIIIDKLDRKVLKVLLRCMEKMCMGEINELRKPVSSYREYLKIIGDKTASFMSACCQTGAMLSGAGEKEVSALKKFGYNFGISYQIIDDYLDNDLGLTFKIDMVKEAKKYTAQARENIVFFNHSKYRESLENLSKFIVSRK